MGESNKEVVTTGVSLTWLPKRVFAVLQAGILILLGMHLLMHAMKQMDHHRVFGLVELFDMDQEQNIPTLFATLLFLLSGFLFYVVWKATREAKEGSFLWLLFAVAMVCMGIDEFGQLHEYLTAPVEEKLDTSGFLSAAWVIPYGGAALIGFAVVLPFLLRLEKGTSRRLITSGIVFLGGAVGVEMITAKYIDLRWERIGDELNLETDLYYGLFVGLEESLEMLGLVIVVSALVRMLHLFYGGLEIRVPDGSE